MKADKQQNTWDEQELYNLYHKKGQTLEEIAIPRKVTRERVRQVMEKLNIKRRRGGARKKELPGLNKEKLNSFYWRQELGLQEIADKYGVSPWTIRNQMVDWGIARRGIGVNNCQ